MEYTNRAVPIPKPADADAYTTTYGNADRDPDRHARWVGHTYRYHHTNGDTWMHADDLCRHRSGSYSRWRQRDLAGLRSAAHD